MLLLRLDWVGLGWIGWIDWVDYASSRENQVEEKNPHICRPCHEHESNAQLNSFGQDVQVLFQVNQAPLLLILPFMLRFT